MNNSLPSLFVALDAVRQYANEAGLDPIQAAAELYEHILEDDAPYAENDRLMGEDFEGMTH